jgi:hypothetical protein
MKFLVSDSSSDFSSDSMDSDDDRKKKQPKDAKIIREPNRWVCYMFMIFSCGLRAGGRWVKSQYVHVYHCQMFPDLPHPWIFYSRKAPSSLTKAWHLSWNIMYIKLVISLKRVSLVCTDALSSVYVWWNSVTKSKQWVLYYQVQVSECKNSMMVFSKQVKVSL